jgi:signal transduction histidine kinase/ligand-binding sensor domain-containing protein/DNA-binding response OmpR family regulator
MNISSVAQDKSGYIWVATMGGVSRYNGYEFKHYYFDSGNPASLRSNHVLSLLSSSDGLLYIGMETGIDCYDSKSDRLIRCFPELKNAIVTIAEYEGFVYFGTNSGLFRCKSGGKELEELGSNLTEKPAFNSLLFDLNGNLWCGLGNGKGLALYDLKSDRFDFFRNNSSPTEFNNMNTVRTLFQNRENVMLLGTKGGLSCFNLKSRQYVDSDDCKQLLSGLAGYDVRFIVEREPAIFWIGTLQSGLFVYDKARHDLVRHFQSDGFDEIHSNNYMSCLTDKSGNVWMGTFDAGLEVSFKQTKNFNYDVSLNKLTKGKFITSISKDRQKNFIIATRENGFFVYNTEKKSYRIYDKTNSQLGYPNIRSVFADSENKYWIGIYFGLQIFDPDKKSFKTLAVPEPNNGAVSIVQMRDKVFVGTEGQGLLIFDLQGNLLDQFLMQGSTIPRIIQLNENELLFTSYGFGLFALNFNDHAIRRIELLDVKKYPGLLNAVTAYKDKEGIIWVGTYNYGLFRMDINKSEVLNFNVREGLPSTDAIGIEEDNANNLWISTSFGLAKLNKSNFNIKTYFVNEGINNYQFHENAAYKDEQGIICFGGNLGLTFFNPTDILLEKSDAPRVLLDNLFVRNLLVTPSYDEGLLTESLPFTKEIILTHKEQHFSIDFVSFDYLSPEKMRYSYILEGYDKYWLSAGTGTQRRVSYSILPRGNYVFKVKSVNGAGVPSENIAQLKIRVKPAPWFTYFAWSIYIGILAAIGYLIFRLRIKAYVYKKDLEIEHLEHLREHEINVMKQKFFTNISHELRTPLTLIYGLVTQLSKHDKLSPQIREYAHSLDLNVNRLLKLINQLLTYKKIESETLTLWLENGNLNDEVHKIVGLFALYAREKEIHLDLIEDNSFTFFFDHDKVEKILSNLLSNAIKHTGKGGRIEVIVKKIFAEQATSSYKSVLINRKSEYIEISVRDNGSGIDKKEWDTIFDRYKQVETDGRQRPDYSGTGIGLNFTKSLIELHKGEIQMISKLGDGATFSFILPLDSSVFEPKDFAGLKIMDNLPVRSAEFFGAVESEVSNQLEIETDFEKTVLIVEDDPQLNTFLVNSLKIFYKTIAAHDGETGLKIVKQQLPDIVISDIMMPKMDGYELTRSIKGNSELCHIPMILLTAKTETSSQIDGMQSGADLYVTKPFNIDFLLAAVESQLKNRKRIHDIFLNGQMPKLDRSEINQLDIHFLSKLNAFLEKEISNPELDILLLAKNMNMSRSAFYRKFMGLTKLSPITYLKKHRINKSIELMSQDKYTHIEISEMTGFGSPSYFSRAFKQEKGMSPREFLNQLKEETVAET